MAVATPMQVTFKDDEQDLFTANVSLGCLIQHSFEGDALMAALRQFEEAEIKGQVVQGASAWTKVELKSPYGDNAKTFSRAEVEEMFVPKKPFDPSKPVICPRPPKP